MEYACRRRNKKFVYIVFNKGVQESKKQEFAALGLRNVEAKTFHSIAYSATLHIHGGKRIAMNIRVPPSGSSSSDSRSIAGDVRKTLEKFMVSSDTAIEVHHIPQKARPPGADSAILAAARDLWEQLSRPGSPEGITHDGYLKCLQLQPELQDRAFRAYDCVMLDEAHDCSDAQLDIFRGVPAAKIIVLDPHQCIYQFRGASSDSIDAVRATFTLPLRRTFRFGAPLAACAVAMVRFFKRPRHQDFAIEGRPDRPTAVHPLADGEEDGLYARLAQQGEPLLVLARQNRTLFEEVLRCLRCPAVTRIGFVGGLDGACGGLDRILDLHRLRRGERVGCPFIGSFRSLEALRAACEADGDDGLGSMCALVERCGADLPARVAEIRARFVEHAGGPQVLFSTVHKAKGLGWPSVYLAGDFLGRGRSLEECLEEAAAGGRAALAALAATGALPFFTPVVTAAHREEVRAAVGDEETNVAYVALTRAEAQVFVHGRTAAWLRFAGALPGPGSQQPPAPTSTPPPAAPTASDSPAAGAATSSPAARNSPAQPPALASPEHAPTAPGGQSFI